MAPALSAAVPVPWARTADGIHALPQVRDTGRGPSVVETASVSGTLVTDEATPHPVRRATMTLGGVPGYGRVTVTDNAGHFAFAGLPAGRFVNRDAARVRTSERGSAPARQLGVRVC